MIEGKRPAMLLVEDDALLAQALAHRAARLGFAPRVCATRAEAIRQAPEARIAVVDLGLPPRPSLPDEGLLLIETLSIRHPEIVVVVQSGQDEEQAAFAALSAGAWDFLSKPTPPEEFDAVLSRAARRAQVGARLAGQGRMLPGGLADPQAGLKAAADAAQERLLRQVLAATGFNVAETARRLDMPRSQLYYYFDKFGIQRPDSYPADFAQPPGRHA